MSDQKSTLRELRNLAEAAGYSIVASAEQIRKADSSYQIGKGKVTEIAELIKDLKAVRLIFDNELKSVQAYNIARETGVEVIDRYQLILEIFAQRAVTAEAKLQIKLARLRYEQAHAKEKVRLAKLGEQPGFMGLGSYEVDLYYNAVQRQLNSIRRKLEKIRKKRRLHRKRRQALGFSLISLAGYTCAGKSTLFNLLVEESVPTENGLFTTLSTTSRITTALGKNVVLTDTVGFIDRLPISLIQAFHSTLEETVFADLILLVVDSSETLGEIERKVSVCLRTLEEIGASDIPVVTALNKIDLVSHTHIKRLLQDLNSLTMNIVPISAVKGHNIANLKQTLSKHLKPKVQVAFSIPLSRETPSFFSWLHNHTDMKAVQYQDNKATVILEAVSGFSDRVIGLVKQHGGTIEKLVELR